MVNSEYDIRLLTEDDEADIQDLCERCSDFSELVEGRTPEKGAGHNILFDLPPGKEMKDKYVLGVYKENIMVTPKDVDLVVDSISKVIANAINIALQPALDLDDINTFLN